MSTLRRTMAATAIAAAAVSGSVVAASAPAQAATASCSGSLIHSIRSYNPSNNVLIAITSAYRSGGTTCVVTVKQNGYYAKNTHMELSMRGGGNLLAHDYGNFQYRAGAISTNFGGCIHEEIDIWNGPVPGGGVNIVQDYDYPGIHC